MKHDDKLTSWTYGLERLPIFTLEGKEVELFGDMYVITGHRMDGSLILERSQNVKEGTTTPWNGIGGL